MNPETILDSFASGKISREEAVSLLKRSSGFEDLGFARLDHSRKHRRNGIETVFCAGKTKEQLVVICQRFRDAGSGMFGTRASQEQYEFVRAQIPDICYDPVSKVLSLPSPNQESAVGCVAVCTGGTADIPVAEEAAQTAEFFGAKVTRCFDVGVAGIHRLFACLDDIRQANAVIAVAGMEGALGSVVSGLVSVPVIAVPTSVGYGASFGGIAPLLSMLNSCAEGMSVVNIDNGFGAGYLAAQINRLACKGKTSL